MAWFHMKRSLSEISSFLLVPYEVKFFWSLTLQSAAPYRIMSFKYPYHTESIVLNK